MNKLTVYNQTQNTQIANQVRIADNPWTRMKGLLGQKSLCVGEALIIRPCQSVHMLFMTFAIDVVFLNSQNQVIGLCPRLPPLGFSPVFWKSTCAIELPAGTIEKTKTCAGNVFLIN